MLAQAFVPSGKTKAETGPDRGLWIVNDTVIHIILFVGSKTLGTFYRILIGWFLTRSVQTLLPNFIRISFILSKPLSLWGSLQFELYFDYKVMNLKEFFQKDLFIILYVSYTLK